MKYKILQLKDIRHSAYGFRDYKYAREHGFNLEDYECVYSGDIEAPNVIKALDDLFVKFNVEHPEDYHAHSLSVSDIVMVDNDYYYCEPFGWERVK